MDWYTGSERQCEGTAEYILVIAVRTSTASSATTLTMVHTTYSFCLLLGNAVLSDRFTNVLKLSLKTEAAIFPEPQDNLYQFTGGHTTQQTAICCSQTGYTSVLQMDRSQSLR